MECFLALFTSENTQTVYNLFGILGFALSAFLWLVLFFNSRKNLKIEIKDAHRLNGSVVQFFLFVYNSSSNPICISSFELIGDNASSTCELIPKLIIEGKSSSIFTPSFPINISAHQGFPCFLEFLNCQDIPLEIGKTVVFLIHTNRGEVNKSLILPNTSHYLHKKS